MRVPYKDLSKRLITIKRVYIYKISVIIIIGNKLCICRFMSNQLKKDFNENKNKSFSFSPFSFTSHFLYYFMRWFSFLSNIIEFFNFYSFFTIVLNKLDK